jgi:predicted AlkP superfamily phosphohydrolase/phosphomutase
MISCFLTPGPTSPYTHPPELADEIERLVGQGRYLFDVRQFRTDDKPWLKAQIFELTAQRFAVVRHLLTTKPWDFFAFVDMGPDRLHHGFWKFWDPQHRQYEPGNPYEGVIPDYYRFLDEQLGQLLQLVDDEVAVFIVSDHGAKRMDGGLCINEWLRREGFLALQREPEGVVSFEEAEVDWTRTVAWGEGGYYSRIFLNGRGREPQGAIAPSEYESVRDELIRKLEALGDEQGRPIGTRVHRPEELYPRVEGIAPDLIALLGDLHWRSIGGLGWGTIWTPENDTGPDDANHSQHGIFIAYGLEREGLQGELQGVKLLDVAPTLLELFGLPVPPELAGGSLLEC